MVSEEECHHVEKRDNYYAILPMLPELSNEISNDKVISKEYSSSDNTLSLSDTKKLLKEKDVLLNGKGLDENEFLG